MLARRIRGFLQARRGSTLCTCWILAKATSICKSSHFLLGLRGLSKYSLSSFYPLPPPIPGQLQPDCVTFSASISALEKVAQWRKAVALYHELRQRGLLPVGVTYNSLSSALQKSRHWRGALHLLGAMDIGSLVPALLLRNLN